MKPLVVMYCLECDWDVSTWSHTRTGLDVLTVEHELIAEHEIGSVWIRQERDDQLRASSDLWQRNQNGMSGSCDEGY